MKEFMMIFVGADYADLGLSPEELQNRMGKWFAWGNKMEQAGFLRGVMRYILRCAESLGKTEL